MTTGVPLGRLGTPDDGAAAVISLALYLTHFDGTEPTVDGGQSKMRWNAAGLGARERAFGDLTSLWVEFSACLALLATVSAMVFVDAFSASVSKRRWWQSPSQPRLSGSLVSYGSDAVTVRTDLAGVVGTRLFVDVRVYGRLEVTSVSLAGVSTAVSWDSLTVRCALGNGTAALRALQRWSHNEVALGFELTTWVPQSGRRRVPSPRSGRSVDAFVCEAFFNDAESPAESFGLLLKL